MRLLKWDDAGNVSMTDNIVSVSDIPPYAILSHTWGRDSDEVTLEDFDDGIERDKAGYAKIAFCAQQAYLHDLQHFWIDTCCINKDSSAELSESLNSMFAWYRNAATCFVYLSDVSDMGDYQSGQVSGPPWELAFRRSRWFTRGWTLQELLAPASVQFFSREGTLLGNKTSLQRQIHEVTGIALAALRGDALHSFGVEERFKWAENRQTTREEDWAYSLMGIFDVSLPALYGEGMTKATRRLKQSIDDARPRDNVLPSQDGVLFLKLARPSGTPGSNRDSNVELQPVDLRQELLKLLQETSKLSIEDTSETSQQHAQWTAGGQMDRSRQGQGVLSGQESSIERRLDELDSRQGHRNWLEPMMKTMLDTGELDSGTHDVALSDSDDPELRAAKSGGDINGETPLIWAAMNGNNAITRLLIKKGADLEVRDGTEGNTPLLWAASKGNATAAWLLLEAGANIEGKNKKGSTPLLLAARNGHEDVARLLLARRADLEGKDKNCSTAIALAAKNGRLGVTRLLIERGAYLEARDINDHSTALLWCAAWGKPDTAQLLLDSGADIEAKNKKGSTPLLLASRNGHAAVVRVLLARRANIEAKDINHSTALALAAKNGRVEATRLLLEKRANLEVKDINYGSTALLWCASWGQAATARLLLEKGADLEARNKNGSTPLALASKKGHEDVTKLLLNRGANPEAKDVNYNSTPLLWCAEAGQVATVRMLLDSGANIEAKNKNGTSSLAIAAKNGHEAVTQLLLERGANRDVKDKNGNTPLSLAVKNGHNAVARLLRGKRT